MFSLHGSITEIKHETVRMNKQTNKLDPQKAVADKNVTEKAHIFCCYEIKRSLK